MERKRLKKENGRYKGDCVFVSTRQREKERGRKREGERERKKERGRKREEERERERQTDRESDRQTDRQRQTERMTGKIERKKKKNTEKGPKINRRMSVCVRERGGEREESVRDRQRVTQHCQFYLCICCKILRKEKICLCQILSTEDKTRNIPKHRPQVILKFFLRQNEDLWTNKL